MLWPFWFKIGIESKMAASNMSQFLPQNPLISRITANVLRGTSISEKTLSDMTKEDLRTLLANVSTLDDLTQKQTDDINFLIEEINRIILTKMRGARRKTRRSKRSRRRRSSTKRSSTKRRR